MRRIAVHVAKAVALHRRLKSWEKVRRAMPRPDGSLFSYDGLWNAVRRYDKGVSKWPR